MEENMKNKKKRKSIKKKIHKIYLLGLRRQTPPY